MIHLRCSLCVRCLITSMLALHISPTYCAPGKSGLKVIATGLTRLQLASGTKIANSNLGQAVKPFMFVRDLHSTPVAQLLKDGRKETAGQNFSNQSNPRSRFIFSGISSFRPRTLSHAAGFSPVMLTGASVTNGCKRWPNSRRHSSTDVSTQIPFGKTTSTQGAKEAAEKNASVLLHGDQRYATGGNSCGNSKKAEQVLLPREYGDFHEIDPVFFALETDDQRESFLKKNSYDRYMSREILENIEITFSEHGKAKALVLAYARELERASIIEIADDAKEKDVDVLTVSGPRNAIQYLADIPKGRVPETVMGVVEPEGDNPAGLSTLWVGKYPLFLPERNILKKIPPDKKKGDLDLYLYKNDANKLFGDDTEKCLSVYSGFQEIGLVYFSLKTDVQQRKYLDSLGIKGDRYLSLEVVHDHVVLSAEREKGLTLIEAYAQQLHKAGIIEFHSTLECFPGRAVITGPANVIQYLNDMPKIVYYGKGYLE